MARIPPLKAQVLEPAAGWPAELEFSIDAPVPGQALHALTVNLRGFVAPKTLSAPLPRVLVVLVQGAEIWRAPIEWPRPDLAHSHVATGARRMALACGFDTLLPTFIDPAHEPLELAVECERVEGTGRLQVPLARLSFSGLGAMPRHGGVGIVTVNSLGRSGSSILCRLLSQHSRVYVPALGGQYGEVFAIGQLARSLAVVGSEGARAEVNRLSTEPDFMVLRPAFNEMDGQPDGLEQECRDKMLRSAVACGVQALSEGLDAVTALSRTRKPRAAWWVEKSWSSASVPLLGVFASQWREIVMVREPQSFLLSQALYLEKIGMPREEMVRHLAATPDKFRRFYSSVRSRRGQVHVVRYEDLLQQPRSVLQGVVRYLELGPSKGFVDRAMSLLAKDDAFRRMLATDATGVDRTGWPQLPDLSPESLGAWFSDMCQDFGYSTPSVLALQHHL